MADSNPEQTNTNNSVMHSLLLSTLKLSHALIKVITHRSAQNLMHLLLCATINDVPKSDTDMSQEPAVYASGQLHPAKLPPDGCS